ncbi:MAG: flagellar biosynthesis protein FlhA, partial [Armatimonadetes bacterium]|nr:flagellar biosynthesis protein FlhA [Armatimonadota bacterium]
ARLHSENAFYGAMDGAARFLRGETLAVALIVVALPLAGLTAANSAALAWTDLLGLALGQGVVVLVPGLLMMAAGALVLSRTDSGAAGDLGRVLLRPSLLVMVAVTLACVAAVPGVAKAPLLIAALAASGLAWHVGRCPAGAAEADPGAELQLRLGTNLLALTARHDLPQWLNRQRLSLSDELGFAVPPFVVADDATLPASDFVVVVNGGSVLEASLRPGRRLAVPAVGSLLPPEGETVVLPDGRAAAWVREADEVGASSGEVHLLDPLDALGLYLRAALTGAAAELFDLQRARELLAAVRVTHPAVVEAFMAAGLGEPALRDVGRALLAGGVPLVERVSLLEGMAEAGPGPAARLVERVRPALRRTITRLVAPEGTLYALELCDEMRQELLQAVHRAGEDEPVALAPERADHWHRTLGRAQQQYAESAVGAVVLCPPELRRAGAQLAREAGAAVAVVHVGELLPLTEIICVGVLPERDTGPVLKPATGK